MAKKQPTKSTRKHSLGTIVLNFRELPPPLNGARGLIRAHWSERKATLERWSWECHNALSDADHETWIGRVITGCNITWRTRTVQLMDWDNQAARFKIMGDALQLTGLLKNDSPNVVWQFVPLQEKARTRKEVGCSVEIEVFEFEQSK